MSTESIKEQLLLAGVVVTDNKEHLTESVKVKFVRSAKPLLKESVETNHEQVVRDFTKKVANFIRPMVDTSDATATPELVYDVIEDNISKLVGLIDGDYKKFKIGFKLKYGYDFESDPKVHGLEWEKDIASQLILGESVKRGSVINEVVEDDYNTDDLVKSRLDQDRQVVANFTKKVAEFVGPKINPDDVTEAHEQVYDVIEHNIEELVGMLNNAQYTKFKRGFKAVYGYNFDSDPNTHGLEWEKDIASKLILGESKKSA